MSATKRYLEMDWQRRQQATPVEKAAQYISSIDRAARTPTGTDSINSTIVDNEASPSGGSNVHAAAGALRRRRAGEVVEPMRERELDELLAQVRAGLGQAVDKIHRLPSVHGNPDAPGFIAPGVDVVGALRSQPAPLRNDLDMDRAPTVNEDVLTMLAVHTADSEAVRGGEPRGRDERVAHYLRQNGRGLGEGLGRLIPTGPPFAATPRSLDVEVAFEKVKVAGSRPSRTAVCPLCPAGKQVWLARVYRASPWAIVEARLTDTPGGPLRTVRLWLPDIEVLALDHHGEQYEVDQEWLRQLMTSRRPRVLAPRKVAQ